MKKSNLKIIQEEDSIIIKKKADVVDYSIHAVIFIACIIFLFILEGAWDEPIFWVVYIACLFTNIASFLFLFLGKIVLDTDKKEISIYNLCRETYRFEEVKELFICS